MIMTLMGQVKQYRRDSILTPVFTALEVVMEVCRNIQVLNLGQLLASGTPEEIQKNPDVIKAYLGERRKRSGEAN